MDKTRSLRALDWINFGMADLQTGVGPFVAVYLIAVRHWDSAQAGIVVAAQSIAMVVAQAPAGALVDSSRCKKCLGVIAAIFIGGGAAGIVFVHSLTGQIALQIVIGMAGSIFPPLISALSLGMVGRAALARRVGRNEAFNHSGNVVFGVIAGLLGSLVAQQWIFYLAVTAACGTTIACLAIRNLDIDNEAARAAVEDHEKGERTIKGLREILSDNRIAIFAAAVVIFHFANAAMLPLAGEVLAKGKSAAVSPLYMSGCVVVAQLVMVPVALVASRLAGRVGRKPILLTGFAVLTIRGLLFSLGSGPIYFIAVQSLDGVGAAIFGVTWVLITCDLAKGTGRFNTVQGGLIAAWNLGAFFSNALAGWTAKQAGFHAAFLGLACLAAFGFWFFASFMPETKESGQLHEARVQLEAPCTVRF